MAEVAIRQIRNITETEKHSLVNVCLKAYKDEPSMPAMLGGRDDLRSLLFHSMIAAGALDGELYVVENKKQEIVSMALWFAPGHSMWSSEAQRNAGYYELMDELDDNTRDWWKNSYGIKVGEFVKKSIPKPSIDCWWLSILATNPNHQGLGYATSLINNVIRKISPPSMAGMCATSQQINDYYNHIGFQTKGHMELPSSFGDISVYCLAREIDEAVQTK